MQLYEKGVWQRKGHGKVFDFSCPISELNRAIEEIDALNGGCCALLREIFDENEKKWVCQLEKTKPIALLGESDTFINYDFCNPELSNSIAETNRISVDALLLSGAVRITISGVSSWPHSFSLIDTILNKDTNEIVRHIESLKLFRQFERKLGLHGQASSSTSLTNHRSQNNS